MEVWKQRRMLCRMRCHVDSVQALAVVAGKWRALSEEQGGGLSSAGAWNTDKLESDE